MASICGKNVRQMKLFYYKKVLPKLPPEKENHYVCKIPDPGESAVANIAEGNKRFHFRRSWETRLNRIVWVVVDELKYHLTSFLSFGYINYSLLPKVLN